ncbi:TRAP transporter substrate-binding protein DctP [Desulfamplus magnetovallimortis]|nr:TRAP transporter substrate-binding protein DctP [Desulfamplus magnetovallimortis]
MKGEDTMRNSIPIRRYFFLILLVSLFLACSTVMASSPQVWKIGHVRSSGSSVDKDIHTFVENITEQTSGDISFNIYPGNRLGDYSTVQERVSFGEVEMYVGPVATSIDKRLMLAFTPFLVTNWSEAQKMYSHGTPMMNAIEEYLEAQNIKLLGGWPVYFGGIALTAKPVAPGNPDISKDMIIRVPPIKSFEMTARALGYTPYPITWMYAKMGLKTGMVTGLIGGGAEGYAGLSEYIKYYIPLKDHFEYWFVYMNLDIWKSLSGKTKNIFNKAAAKMEIDRYAVAEAEEEKSLTRLKTGGIEIIELTDLEQSALQAKVKSQVWPLLKEETGPVFDTIVNQK